MRYRLMATYRGAPYEAGIGPANGQVVLFAACPPPEELGFEPATGHWRKEMPMQDVQAVWESRPVGMFRGERCIVLDDLGERLHIGFLGHDGYRAEQLGYWQVDRGVFELVAARDEVTEINEERTDYPGQAAARPAAGTGRPGLAPPTVLDLPVTGEPGRAPAADGGVALPPPPSSAPPLPLEAEAMRAASQASRRDQPDPLDGPGPRSTPGLPTAPGPLNGPGPLTAPGPLNGPGPLASSGPLTTPGPLNGPSPLHAPASGNTPAPLNGPGPLGGSSSPRSAGPRSTSGQHSRPTPLNAPGPLSAPGPRSSQDSFTGPAPLSRPGPLGDPAPPAAPDPLTGSASRREPGRSADRTTADRTAARMTLPAGPAPTGPGLLEPAPPAARENGTGPRAVPAPRAGDLASRLHAAPVTGELPVVSQDRLGPAAPSFTPGPSAVADREDPAKPDFRPGPANPGPANPGAANPGPATSGPATPRPELRDHLPARDFPAGTPIPPSAVMGQPAPVPPAPATRTNQAGPASLPVSAPASSGPLNGASPAAHASPARSASAARSASTDSTDRPAKPRRRRAAKRRMATERIFGELASLAAIPSSAYSVGEEVDGAMCLMETTEGFEVFTSAGGSRHEVRVFSDEESACFYLFGVLAADAVRTGVLVPGQVARDPIPARPREPLAGLGEPVLHR